jgi:hypothetical protein
MFSRFLSECAASNGGQYIGLRSAASTLTNRQKANGGFCSR